MLFIGVAAFWAAAYLGTAGFNAARAPRVLAWDAIWIFPFVSAFVVPYLSAYALPFVAAASLRDRAKFRRFAAVAVGTMAFSAICFILFPLTLARPEIPLASLSDRLLAALYAADRPTNLFPSLHVSLSFLFALAVGDARPRLRPWMIAWAALVAVSTLFTRQHYLIDVVGGVIVAWIAWRIYLPKSR